MSGSTKAERARGSWCGLRAGAALATILSSAALAAPPTPMRVGPAVGAGGPTGATLPPAGPGSTVVCDQMSMVKDGTFTDANGNAIAGLGVFGLTYDLQLADDCVHTATLEITQVCQASVTFFGLPPTDLWVQVYADAGGTPANTATFEETATDVTVTPFVDTVFGLDGEVICADLAPGFVVPAGTWWWNIQPVSLAANADWYYQVRRTNVTPAGGDTFGRSGAAEHGSAFGGPYPGGYGGTMVWVSMLKLFYPPGDSAFSVTGQPVIVDADLAVSKDDGQTSATSGDPIIYTIVVSNLGPADASATTVSDALDPALTGVTWACSATPGSSCTAAGAGDIDDLADILASGAVTYTVNATIDPAFTGALDNTATAAVGAGTVDPDPANDAATDSTVVLGVPVAAVPTLGEIGLLLLVVMLAVAALVTLRLRAL